jgi:cyclic nucleotide-binding protein
VSVRKRIEASVTAITWLPFEALDRMPTVPLELAFAHHDEPPPARLPPLEELRRTDSFREANELRAWIDVQDGAIVDYGHEGRGLVGDPGLELGLRQVAFAAVEFPALQPEPEVGVGWVRFAQTVGGRIGLPAAHPLPGKPYFHLGAISSWTTLELVIHADGTHAGALVASSPFPRHSLYSDDRTLLAETTPIDFDDWYLDSLGPLAAETPWGRLDTPAFLATFESQLERELATSILRTGERVQRRRLTKGETLVEQGEEGTDLFILLDGVLDVEENRVVVAQVGSGAVLGERAVLEGGRRTATLRAARSSRVAVIRADQISRDRLAQITRARSERRAAPSPA